MKKITGLILVLTLLLSAIMPAFAADTADVIPIIDIRGFMSSQIYEDKQDGASERLFPPENDALLGFVAKIIPAISAVKVTGDWGRFGDKLIPLLNDLLLPLASDNDGNLGSTGPLVPLPTKDEVIKKPQLNYSADWRADPFDAAAALDEYIRYLAVDCGFGQVSLDLHSYAGIVGLVYLSKYGTQYIKSVCFDATAVFGALFAGELIRGHIEITAEGLSEFLKGLVSQADYEGFVNGFVDIAAKVGGVDCLCSFIDDMFTNLHDRIWSESLVPLFAGWLSVWAMVPDDTLDEGLSFTGINGFSPSGVFSGRFAQYNESIRTNRAELLAEINSKINLYVIARYGYAGIPIGDTWRVGSDTILTTNAEAFGATFVSDRESADIGNPYISPDGTIDASGCLFPEQTWFVRNCRHTEKDAAIRNFSTTLLAADEQLTVSSNPDYPRFLLFDKERGGVVCDDGLTRPARRWYDDIIAALKRFFERIQQAFSVLTQI